MPRPSAAHPVVVGSTAPTTAGSGDRAPASRVAAPAADSPPTTRSPFVTLEPTRPGGQIPGPANDASDFYGLGAAVIGIVLVIVLAKFIFRGRPTETRERDE